MKHLFFLAIWVLLILPISSMASPGEGTRHISGSGMDLFFMDDKVFGTANDHPLWAIYNCGSDIFGTIDINGTYHEMAFAYHREGDYLMTGTLGDLTLSMGKIEKTEDGLVYHVIVENRVHRFTIRYHRRSRRDGPAGTVDGRRKTLPFCHYGHHHDCGRGRAIG